MKKVMVWVLSLTLMLSAAAAYAENEEPFFEQFAGMAWSFCAGVGGWSTDLEIQADGSFSGTFHDSEMGDIGEGYPYGTIYICSFTGRMSLVEQVDENTWKIRVDALNMDEGQVEEEIEDEIRFVTVEDAYGISEGDEMLLYQPGTPVSALSENMQFWAHVVYNEDTRLENWFLGSEANDSGFVGFRIVAESALENPLVDLTAVAEQVYAKTDRRDGERFEGVITLEGMEETVRYEHIRNDAIGFEMDYDYERFERRSESERERFVSRYDDPNNPENYLEVTYSPADADDAASSVGEALSNDYDIIVESFALNGAGSCTRIDASEAKGGKGTPDLLQMVYIIPADDGSLIATAHYVFESAEGFGARFRDMMHTLVVIDGHR